MKALASFTILAVVLLGAIADARARDLEFTDLLARPRPAASERIQYGAAPSEFADLWLPPGAGPRRVVVLIHGGCWRANLPGVDLTAYAAEDLRQHGFAVWNIEYRRLGEDGGGYPGSYQDVATAVDWLRKLPKSDRLDLRHVIAVGHSSGGHLALWTAARPRLPKSSPLYASNPLPIEGVVSLAGIGDLDAYRRNGPQACGGPGVVEAVAGLAARGPFDVFTDTSPVMLLPLGVPQAIVSGARDPIVPPAFGKAYAARAAAAGDRVEEVTLPDAAHFELIDPQSPAFATVRALIERMQK